MKNILKKTMSIALAAVLVLSMGLSSFALLDKYDGDTNKELTTDQKRILNSIENDAKVEVKKAGEFGDFESKLYDREFDSGSTIKTTKSTAAVATKPATTTTTKTNTTNASVESYFEKYFNNTVVAISLKSSMALAEKDSNSVGLADIDFNVEKLTKMDVNKICYYYYDVVANKYYPIFDSSKVDLNSSSAEIEKAVTKQALTGGFEDMDYTNFMDGYIIASDGPLVKK